MDSIHCRFEDRPMRWSENSYRFVQWRPDGDSDPNSRHYMWVFILMLFSYLLLSVGVHMLLVSFHVNNCYILPFDLLYYFMRISDCSPYLCNWLELVSVSFHVLVNRRCWLSPSLEYLGLWLDSIYWLAELVHIWTSNVYWPYILILRHYIYTTWLVTYIAFTLSPYHAF